MGARIGCAVACLTMGYIERNLLEHYSKPTPVFFKRYIDDILGIFVGPRQDLDAFILHVSTYPDSIKFTNGILNTGLPFLDLNLTIQDDYVSTTIYSKDTDSHSYLRYESSHPPACKNSIPYSQPLRANRTCSQDNDFDDVAEHMVSCFTTGATRKASQPLHSTASRTLKENKL